MANSSNLMPIELLNARRTREERSENAKKAGKASGEARNQKANFKKALNLLLTAQVETEWTEQLQALGFPAIGYTGTGSMRMTKQFRQS